MLHQLLISRAMIRSSIRTRLFKIASLLITAIAFFSFIFWQVEKPHHPDGLSYLDSIQTIAIFTISGFDADPPNTLIGWISAIISLILGIVLVGAFTAEIASIFVESRMKEHSAVKSVDFSNHLLFCGTLSDVDNFFNQIFHPDHGNTGINIVFLMPEKPTPQIEKYLSNTKYKYRVKYIIGSPLDQDDLIAAKAHKAKNAFIFTNRFAENQNEQDAQTILMALAIEAFNKEIDTFVQLLQSKNRQHLEAAGADNIVCIDELTRNLAAFTCLNPGLSNVVENLLNSSSSNSKRNVPEWKEEENDGADQEIYRVKASDSFNGKTFSEVSSHIFNQFNITTIAQEKPIDDEEYKFAVNPGDEWKIEKGDSLFVIADDLSEAQKITSFSGAVKLPNFDKINQDTIKANSGWKGEKIAIENAVLEKVNFENHILICGNTKNLESLISPLRSEDLNSFSRIVILNQTLPTNLEDLTQFNEIYFVEGSPHNFDDLERVNAKKADKALVMANSKKVSKSDEVLLDSDAIMSVMGIENICEDVYTIAELLYASNIKFLKPQVSEKGGGDNRFTVDEVITISRVADSLMIQEFFTPNVLEIFNEIFSVFEDDDRNTCEVYQVKVGDLFNGKNYGDVFNQLSLQYHILPIGLYRQNPDGDGYNYTNPKNDTILKDDDKIFVFAPDQPVIG